jgi:hypothetical protein
MKKYKVWTCKIVIADDAELPPGFDSPPRMAAEGAVEDAGFEVLMNSSGWGGSLNKYDLAELERVEKQGRQDAYYAGTMDAPEDVAH